MDDHDDLQARLRSLGAQAVDPARQSADLTAMARVRPPTLLRSKARLGLAFLAGLLLGSTGLAAADALPDPAQHVAHTVLGHVGVEVPNPARYHGPECGPEVKANHGAYVRDDHSLAKSDCGKPQHAGKAAGVGKPGKADATAEDGCHGKPPWAGNKTMTPEQKAAAQAERAARCGTDADELDSDAPEIETPETDEQKTDQDTDEESTTTTVAPTTSTTAEAPTTTESTTSTSTLAP